MTRKTLTYIIKEVTSSTFAFDNITVVV